MSHIMSITKTLILATILSSGLGAASQAYAYVVSLKNYRQIYYGLATATRIPQSDTLIRTTYRNTASRLPLNGKVEEFTSPAVIAVMELAGAFCQRMIERDGAISDPALRVAHKTINFSLKPLDLTSTMIDGVFNEYGFIFWGRAPNTVEHAHLRTLFAAAAQAQSTDAHPDKVLKSVCVAFASAIDHLVY